MEGKQGAIDDLIENDPAVNRVSTTLDNGMRLDANLQSALAPYIGKPTKDVASDVVSALYNNVKEGEKVPFFVKKLAEALKLDLSAYKGSYEDLIAEYGITRDQIKEAIMNSGATFKANTVEQVIASLAARYTSKALEAEPARIENIADRHGLAYGIKLLKRVVEKVGGEPAVKSLEARLGNVNDVARLREVIVPTYQGLFQQYRTATAGAY